MRSIPQPVLARTVTYGVLGLLLVTAATGLEAWPLTSFRLFSGVRTDTSSGLELVADVTGGDAGATVVRPDPENPVLATTTHRYRELVPAPPAERREMVRAWLGAAGIDPQDVETVRLERVGRAWDAGTHGWSEVSRETVLEVRP